MQDLPAPIIRSKLHAPPVASDAVVRERLMALAPGPGRSRFALISAPAGYGKSTLASQWLDASEGATAWLSLDKSDNDLRHFLSYLIAAVRGVFPGTFEAFVELLNTAELPVAEQLAQSFCVEFEDIGEPLTLALDDYHSISATEVHDFMDALLQRPPLDLHLVLLTRRDPPLALQSMRAKGVLTEARSGQLAFTPAESAEFIRRVFHGAVSEWAVATLHERTEGWPAALRLAHLAAPPSEVAGKFIERIPSDIHLVRSYLMHEVLAKCEPAIREMLLRTAFLDRFCEELCEAVLPDEPRDSKGSKKLSGAEFMQRIRDAGLFGIALDTGQQWYRYHHLFQSMLQDQALSSLGQAEITRVHERASGWLEQHAFLEEAIDHLLTAGLATDAAELIIRHRNDIMNAEQWNRLATWLNLLPEGMVESRPELLLLLARLHRTRGGREEIQQALNQAQKLLENTTIDPVVRNELLGSFESNRCYQLYAASDGKGAVDAARRALELLPPDSQAERGFAMVILAGALQMNGNAEEARRIVFAEMPDEASDSTTYASRLLLAAGFVNWMDADLEGLRPVAIRIMEIAAPANLGEALTASKEFLSSTDYHQNHLSAVTERFGSDPSSDVVISAEFYAPHMIAAALAHQESGRPTLASQYATVLQNLSLKSRNTFLIGLSQAFDAELALRQGRKAQAVRWAASYDPEPLTPMYGFFAPPTVLAKILVIEDTAESRARATSYLERLVSYLEAIHNRHFLIEALAIRAMLREAEGDPAAALADLERAVRIAQPGRYIRLFVDLGPRLGSLLSRLKLDDEALCYVGEILAGFRHDTPQRPGQPDSEATAPRRIGIEPLSRREQQILRLLSERLSYKEIASQLNISPVTVKRHAANIYEKLGVHGRRQAVAKATGLGMITSSA